MYRFVSLFVSGSLSFAFQTFLFHSTHVDSLDILLVTREVAGPALQHVYSFGTLECLEAVEEFSKRERCR